MAQSRQSQLPDRHLGRDAAEQGAEPDWQQLGSIDLGAIWRHTLLAGLEPVSAVAALGPLGVAWVHGLRMLNDKERA